MLHIEDDLSTMYVYPFDNNSPYQADACGQEDPNGVYSKHTVVESKGQNDDGCEPQNPHTTGAFPIAYIHEYLKEEKKADAYDVHKKNKRRYHVFLFCSSSLGKLAWRPSLLSRLKEEILELQSMPECIRCK